MYEINNSVYYGARKRQKPEKGTFVIRLGFGFGVALAQREMVFFLAILSLA